MRPARYLAAAAALLLLWQLGALWFGARVLPSPWAVLRYFFQEVQSPAFWVQAGASLWRAGSGLFLGFMLAFPLGVFSGSRPRIDAWLAPLIFLTYPVPKVLFLPVFLVLLGLGEAPKILIVALTAGYQILVVTRDSVRTVDRGYLDSFAILDPGSRGRWRRLARHVLIPASLPAAVSALRVASGTAVAVLFIAESFVTDRGLGFLIIDAWGAMDLPRMFTGILAMGLLGLLLYEACNLLEHLLCRWIKHR